MAVFRARRDAQQIQRAKDDATEELWTSYLAEARARRASGRAGQRFDSLDAVRKAAAIRPNLAVRNEAIACLAVSDLRPSKQATLKGHPPGDLACFDFNLERYVVGEDNGSITVRAVANDQVMGVLSAPGFTLMQICGFSPNSRYLSVRYWQEREGEQGASESDCVWDLEQGKAIVRVVQREAGLHELGSPLAVGFSPDSRLFVSSRPDGTVSIYDLGSGTELRRLPGSRQFNHLSLGPGNTRLACSSQDDHRVEIRDAESGRNITTLACAPGVSALAWSADGKRLATACMDYRICIWDAENGGPPQTTLEGHTAPIISVAFNHSGNLLASASFEGLTRLWSPDTGRQVASHPGGSWQVQFSPDDRRLLGWQNVSHYGSLAVAYRQRVPPALRPAR